MKGIKATGAKCCAISLVLTMSVAGCTSFQPISHDAQGADTIGVVHSSCSNLKIDPEHDIKVGDEIRYQACDGTAGSMTVERVGQDTVGGADGEIDLREMRTMAVKSVSVGRTVLFGVGVSAAVAVAAFLIFSAAVAAAILGAT